MSQNIATLTSASNVFDTHAKWLRLLEKQGVTQDQLLLPMNDRKARRNLAAFLAAGCPKFPTASSNGASEPAILRTLSPAYQAVEAILGDDFITPEEVMEERNGITYTGEQLAEFEHTLPSKEELEWLRDNGFMLVPGPNRPMSCLDIRALEPKFFYTKTGGWYAEDHQKFSRDEKVGVRWFKLRKEPVPNSTSKNWEEQQPLISNVEYIPNDAEVEWCITTYKAVRGVYLLQGIYVRTSSHGSDGHRVVVGCFGETGLRVDSDWDDDRLAGLGVASARK